MRQLAVFLILNSTLAAAQTAGAIPLFFVPNRGQAPAEIRFMSKGSGITAYFAPDEVLYRSGRQVVRARYLGAGSVPPEGLDEAAARANFLVGEPETWQTDVPLYGGVIYRNLYPGIDLRFGADGRALKSEFRVAPGADPSLIRIQYSGVSTLRMSESGELVIPLDGRELKEQPLVVYQELQAKRTRVEGRYLVSSERGIVRLQLGEYDHSLPLVIDPTLSFSTLVGGSNSEAATGLAVDAAGAAYITGFTASYNFPTANPEQNLSGGGNDVFVAKLNATGNGLVYCTYIGGSADDRAYGIAVDAAGEAYVTGSTTSRNFPTRRPLQSVLVGSRNAFVLKLSSVGNALVFSTYLGGSGSDAGNGIALDPSGNAYVVGDTTSVNLPATGLQKTSHGGQDVFVASISSDGSRLPYVTYLGGTGTDHGAAIAVDASGTAYITGSTTSADFPLAGALQKTLAGGQDAFVARLAAGGGSLVFSTYLGGSGGAGYTESGQGIALDPQGNAYVAGVTPAADFPLLNPLQSTLSGAMDAFVAKLTSSGALAYSTFFGGASVEIGNAIAVDSSGKAYLAGYTASTDLPMQNPIQSTNHGGYDAFLAQLGASGNTLLWSTYLGGSGTDTATALALDSSGNLFVAGYTMSANFPLVNPFQSVNTDNYAAFVTKIGFAPVLPINLSVTPSSGTGSSQVFTLQFSDSSGAADLSKASVLVNSSTGLANACSVIYNPGANTIQLLSDSGVAGASITPGAGTLSNSQCTLNGAGSSVSSSGALLTVNVALSFQAPFNGLKTVYLQSANPAGITAWEAKGAWTVQVLGTPSAVSLSPSSGSGSTQTFSFQFSDNIGATDLSTVSALFNTSPSTAGACSVTYTRAQNTLMLLTDTGANPGITITPGSGTQQNSQCILTGSGSTVGISGNSLTLNLALTFTSAFSGTRTVYLQAANATSSTGWLAKSTWAVPGGNNWAFQFGRTFTIDHTKVPNTDQSSFPLLISGVYNYLATAANGGKVQNANGYDIVFSSDPAGGNLLKFERERYVPTTGEVIFWVNVPLLSHTADTVIYMWYGNASVGSDLATPAQVWDSAYKGVWHLPNGTTLSAPDSTSNGNNGTVVGAQATSGEIGGGANSTAAGQYIDVGSSSSLTFTNAFTLEAWINPATLANCHACIIMARPNSYELGAYLDGTVKWAFNNLNPGWSWQGTAPITAGVWQHIVVTYNNGLAQTYVNGALAHSYSGSGNLAAPSYGLRLMNRPDLDAPLYGKADEFRVSNIARSADWIATQYRNQSAPATFYTLGAEN